MVDGNEWIRRTREINITTAQTKDYTWDAGLILYSAISGVIFEDPAYIDNNLLGVPLPGSRATLYYYPNATTSSGLGVQAMDPAARNMGEGVVVQGPVTVGADGRYRFDNLSDGTYRVFFELPDNYEGVAHEKTPDPDINSHMGWEFVTDENGRRIGGFSEVLDIQSKNNPNPFDETFTVYDNINAGGRVYSSLGDYVWRDLDNNGFQDPGEPPIEGIQVTLQRRSGSGGEWKTVNDTVTNANGYYRFGELEAGPVSGYQYRVIFGFERNVIPTIMRAGGDNDRDRDSDMTRNYIPTLGYTTDVIDLGYGVEDMTWDAGVGTLKNLIGDTVWFDTNANGIQDEGEPGVGGINVWLEYSATGDTTDNNAWEVVAKMATDSLGHYQFANLDEGHYRVKFQILSPYMPTVANVSEATIEWDSDATVSLGEGWYASRSFYVYDDTHDPTWDAGLIDENTTWYEGGGMFTNYVFGTGGFRTGDETDMKLWMIVIIAAGIGIVCAVMVRKKLDKRGGKS